jgi:tryptophan halogenase
MEIPKTLSHRIELFKENAHAFQADGELFRVDSWTQVMLGQGIVPEDYHHFARMMSDKDLGQLLNGLKSSIKHAVAKLPGHQEFLDRYCRSGSVR